MKENWRVSMLMKPTALSLALEEADRLQSNGTWVEIDTRVPGIVHMSWGTIHSNGQWERAIASRRYVQEEHMVSVGPVMVHP